jgi:hypothetical protein
MRLYKTKSDIIIESESEKKFFVSRHNDWDTFINRDNLFAYVKEEIAHSNLLTRNGFPVRQLKLPLSVRRYGLPELPI